MQVGSYRQAVNALADLAPAGLDDMSALFEALSDGDFDRTIPAHVPSGLPPGGYLD